MSQPDRPDIIATMRFRTTEEGGRNGPILTDILGTMFVLGSEVFDCVLMLEDRPHLVLMRRAGEFSATDTRCVRTLLT